MKLFAFSAVLLVALGLMSFSVAPTSGVTRLGETLYQVDPTSQLSDADSDFILSTVAREYRLGEYKMIEGTLDLTPLAAKKGNWIIRKKLFLSWLDENFITWETVPAEKAEVVAQLNKVISKYANK
jgi:hypothetical protein